MWDIGKGWVPCRKGVFQFGGRSLKRGYLKKRIFKKGGFPELGKFFGLKGFSHSFKEGGPRPGFIPKGNLEFAGKGGNLILKKSQPQILRPGTGEGRNLRRRIVALWV